MTKHELLNALKKAYGEKATFGYKVWFLESSKIHITIYYAYNNDGQTIVGIGSSYEDLLK